MVEYNRVEECEGCDETSDWGYKRYRYISRIVVWGGDEEGA